MSSFEVKLEEDSSVCQVLPATGPFTTTYTGPLQGELSGAYQTELATRVQNPADPTKQFVKYSRFQKLQMLTSSHGHLGYLRMKMVGTGACISSAVITTFFFDGGTAYVPGVDPEDPVALYGNSL